MRHPPVRARSAARVETLEARQLLSLLPAAPAPIVSPTSGPTTYHVDDDRQQDPNAEFVSIEEAVLVAPPGSTIIVYPGFYHEVVTVDKTLRLLGSSHDRSAARSNGGADPQHDSIVQFEAAPAGIFSLGANDIELDGFVIQNNAAGMGVYTSPAFSGYLIERNTIQNNVFGLYVNASGATESVVRGNWFNANNAPGAASGDGIYSDQGLRNLLVEQNVFTHDASASMVFTSVPPTLNGDITVRHNAIIDDNAIVVVNTRNVLVEKNFIRGTDGSGIFDGGGNSDVLIDSNLLDETGTSGIVVSSDFAPASTGVLVTRNLIGDAGRKGILLFSANGVQVKRNIVMRSALDGIQVEDSNDNLIAGNLSLHNGRDGIRVASDTEPTGPTTSANNQIVGNTMRQNAEHDAHDDTFGPGTAGTANYWIDNNCKTENRPGICGHSHDDHDDAYYTSQEQSYSTTLSSDPLVGDQVVVPTFDAPVEPEVPVLTDLDVLGTVSQILHSPDDKVWLDR